MTRFTRITTFALAGVFAASLAAAQTPTSSASRQSTTPKPSTAKSSTTKPASKTTLVASGALTKFDAATNMITVKTNKGDMSFTLTPTTRLEQGSKPIKLPALTGLVNHSARVQYTEHDGQTTVQSVHLSNAPAKAKL